MGTGEPFLLIVGDVFNGTGDPFLPLLSLALGIPGSSPLDRFPDPNSLTNPSTDSESSTGNCTNRCCCCCCDRGT
ncbi:hypothetical protein P691DRAFT_804453 [Macrolepiota fuliginosa MF-IS2]|uniref:Uncharacterized protein n=1 Tax=Macrolepiota fuliginosa MF-IS2 TaxID=1400762 RepID=A0A9P6BW11_9AGAR|nr:hypothetical protein P691DRAFT_812929 [Macrolepiota fuliginosa MF-IS2]KAF9446212.1 hypothetical protein P691DRAFT_804453 [Macrolepiota fuliginosa MF-IS2]